jgi:hypothetical protein
MHAADALLAAYDALANPVDSLIRNGDDGAIMVGEDEGRSNVYLLRRCNQARARDEEDFMVSRIESCFVVGDSSPSR